MVRFHFKSDLKYDKALLRETNSINPYSLPLSKASPFWEQVSENLNNSTLKLPVTGRNCRERVTVLLKEFKKMEASSSKASGIVETVMDEVTSLLTSIASLEGSRPKPTTGKTVVLTKKQEAVKIRQRAEDAAKELMENTENEGDCEDSSEILGVGDNGTTQVAMDGPAPAKRPKNQQTEGLVAYLKEKAENEKFVKLEELKVRSAEAENKKLDLKEKQNQEADERKKTSDLLLKLIDQIGKK